MWQHKTSSKTTLKAVNGDIGVKQAQIEGAVMDLLPSQ